MNPILIHTLEQLFKEILEELAITLTKDGVELLQHELTSEDENLEQKKQQLRSDILKMISDFLKTRSS